MKNLMIDSHSHLTDTRLCGEITHLLQRMAEAGVGQVLVVGNDLASSRAALALAREYPRLLRASLGVHPHEATTMSEEILQEFRLLAADPLVVAIGEIGLDYHYDFSPRPLQQTAFRAQITLAKELNLPLIIHEREAVDDIFAILDETAGWQCGGSWHCCSTELPAAQRIAEYFYLGIAGWVTFPKAQNIHTLAREMPLNRLLLETDAPYITPVPFRGKTNEPAYLQYTCAALAELQGTTAEEVAAVTNDNTRRAFPRWDQVNKE